MKYPKRKNSSVRADTRLNTILQVAARIISTDGYQQATMRKVSRGARISLSGIYYYVSCKEELLFLIQYHTFDLLVKTLEERTKNLTDPEAKLRAMVINHLEHFIAHMHELRVCVHEMETLKGKYYREVLAKRRAYFRQTMAIVDGLLAQKRKCRLDGRLLTLYLFGMLNWIYMWYRREKHQSVDFLADQLVELFLRGVYGSAKH